MKKGSIEIDIRKFGAFERLNFAWGVLFSDILAFSDVVFSENKLSSGTTKDTAEIIKNFK